VLRILDEASQLRAYRGRWRKSRLAGAATAELRAANEQLKSLDRLKDDFMSQRDARAAHAADQHPRAGRTDARRPDMPPPQRQQFLGIIVAETERLSAWSTRCWTWPRSSPATPNGTTPTSTCARWWSRRCRPRPRCSASGPAVLEVPKPPTGAHAAADPDRLTAGAAEPAVQRGQVRAAPGGQVSCGG
jgi:hypothetical protein